MSTELDNKVIELQKRIEEKKKKISQAERPTWKTNLAFPRLNGSGVINLQAVQTEDELVDAFRDLYTRWHFQSTAVKALGAKPKEFKYSGYSLEDWQSDFKTRLSMLSLTAERRKLQQLEATLGTLESQELKNKKALESVEKMLEEDED